VTLLNKPAQNHVDEKNTVKEPVSKLELSSSKQVCQRMINGPKVCMPSKRQTETQSEKKKTTIRKIQKTWRVFEVESIPLVLCKN